MLHHRLQKLISVLRVQKNQFSEQIGFSQAYVSMILNGKRLNPSDRFYQAVHREYNVNVSWLRDGVGNMFDIPKNDSFISDDILLKKYNLLSAEDRVVIDRIIDAMILKTASSSTIEQVSEK